MILQNKTKLEEIYSLFLNTLFIWSNLDGGNESHRLQIKNGLFSKELNWWRKLTAMALFKSLLVWISKTWCSFATGCFLGNKVYWVFIGAIILAPAAVQRPGKKQTDKERLPIHRLLMGGPSQNCHPILSNPLFWHASRSVSNAYHSEWGKYTLPFCSEAWKLKYISI